MFILWEHNPKAWYMHRIHSRHTLYANWRHRVMKPVSLCDGGCQSMPRLDPVPSRLTMGRGGGGGEEVLCSQETITFLGGTAFDALGSPSNEWTHLWTGRILRHWWWWWRLYYLCNKFTTGNVDDGDDSSITCVMLGVRLTTGSVDSGGGGGYSITRVSGSPLALFISLKKKIFFFFYLAPRP